jgi:predicted amidophosphoribosyltransferase
MPLVPVVAMATYPLGGELHRHLRGYKDAIGAEARAAHVAVLAGRIGPWMDQYGRPPLRFGSTWDVVTTVPSTRRSSGRPVESVVAEVEALGHLHVPLLVRGPDPTDHLVASRHGFELATPVELCNLGGARVLVVDDSIVTGARAQSAAAALRLGRARVVGVLALGRVVDSATPAG